MSFSPASKVRQPPSGKGVVASHAIFSICLVLTLSAASALAQNVATTPVQPPVLVKPGNGFGPAATATGGPAWKDLTPAQQRSLKPLAGTWTTLGEGQKRKWVAIAANYQTMNADEQLKLHSRMTEWVSLSQQQRTQARLNFAESKQLTPDQKTATWEAYQALSAEEKEKLAIAAKPKPVGAAAAIKPVAPDKLATVPVTRKTTIETQKPPDAKPVVNSSTLLPHVQHPAGSASAAKN